MTSSSYPKAIKDAREIVEQEREHYAKHMVAQHLVGNTGECACIEYQNARDIALDRLLRRAVKYGRTGRTP